MEKFGTFLLALSLPFWTAAEELKENKVWFNSFGQLFYEPTSEYDLYDTSLIEQYIQSDKILTATLEAGRKIHFQSDALLSKFITVDQVNYEKNMNCNRPVSTTVVLMTLENSDKNSSVAVHGCNFETLQYFSVALIQNTQEKVIDKLPTGFPPLETRNFQKPGEFSGLAVSSCECFANLERLYEYHNKEIGRIKIIRIVMLIIAASIAAGLILEKLFRGVDHQQMLFVA